MEKLKRELMVHANPDKAKVLQSFFKTGDGQYGAGDVFLGISVPELRVIAKDASGRLLFADIQKLLNSKIHEERLVGLLILVEKYNSGDDLEKERVFKFYKTNTKRVNNWDLVDLTAPNIVGDYLLGHERDILYTLASSEDLWERRIAIVSTFAFIRAGQFEDTLKIAEILINDSHDLIHKAVGWMLREVGKRSLVVEEDFLRARYKEMPRTMLRYAIERFSEEKRKRYLENGV